MVFVSICIGSSCHLKGSGRLVELFEEKIKESGLDDEIVLSGSFCLGKCNREGVTISVGDGISEELVTGIKPEDFKEFWSNNILPRIDK